MIDKMKKTAYIIPQIKTLLMTSDTVMQAASALDPNEGNQSVTPTDDEYDGEFGARQYSVWSDEN
jgi:hypothetical protein